MLAEVLADIDGIEEIATDALGIGALAASALIRSAGFFASAFATDSRNSLGRPLRSGSSDMTR
ncbi:hypothetical protein AB0B78_00685 [Streptomyces sp. NPDC040724]|uniref:hypothetical protein n=1 Tax=Streptomyces sp. NPDC040724 TaxID=3155612 RepID=UPI0033C824D9